MSKQGGGGEKGDMETNMLFIGIGVILLLVGAWILFGPRYSSTMGILRRYELIPFTYFFPRAADIQAKLADINGGSLSFTNTLLMLASSGYYVRWLYIPILPVLAISLLIRSTRGRYQRQHTMATLAAQESVIWPEIAPIVGKHDLLMKGDEHTGDWAVALTEWEFADKHKLAVRPVIDGKVLPGGAVEVSVNRDKARAIFVKQLGPRWSGAAKLSKHRRGLYAAFLLRIAGESNEGLRVLRVMAKSFAEGGLKKMDTSFADGVIAKYGKHEHVLRAISQHDYVFTLMATLLQLSRADGVLASPMFIWLKTCDRGLWYMLNNVGRYAFHVECAGTASHWLFEKTVGQACPTPMVEKAIDGLKMGLQEYTKDDALDRLYT